MRAGINALLSAGVLLLAGCGAESKVQFAEVSGTVSYGGKPLAGAEVTFYPVAAGPEGLPYSVGLTDDAGKYTLTEAGGKRPGAVIGKCRVVVNWPMRDRSDDRTGAAGAKPQPPLPVQYTVAGTTPLQVEVKPGGPHTIDLKLEN